MEIKNLITMAASRIIQILIIVFISACSNNSQKASQEGAVQADSLKSVEHETDHDSRADNGVSLNDGKKWKANAETTEGINKMTGYINALPAEPSLENYHSLKTALETEFNLIIEKCTMTGEAHEQLHHYLIPLRESIEHLGSEDISKCRSSLDAINSHLGEYASYFEQ
jgi:hypothetical protein